MPREMDGEASLCSCKLYFPACTWGLRRHHCKAYWDFLTLKKCIINIRGWGGCTQATLKVICDLKYDQDICWMWSLVFIWWNWICLLNIMRDFECDRDACWTWLIFDVLNVNVWNVHVECDVWPWIWSRCLLNLINFHVLNANVIVECDRYPWMWSNLSSWILHHLAFHNMP